MKKEKIIKLIDEHLIGYYQPEENFLKAHYRISVENLIDFLEKYFIIKYEKK